MRDNVYAPISFAEEAFNEKIRIIKPKK